MQKQEEGEIELLDTIRCPKLLRNLHKQLPECKSVKRLVTVKDIEEEDKEQKVYPRSMKKIGSSKLLREEKENDKIMDVMKVSM